MNDREVETEVDSRKSKSQVKREMSALQKMGEELVALSKEQIQKLKIADDFKEALLFAKTLKHREARRRQIQYIGALMRGTNLESIEQFLKELAQSRMEENWRFQQLEKWRDGLLNGQEKVLEEVLEKFPAADRKHIRQLIRNNQKEREQQKPPKSSRALFQYLKEISEPT